MTPPYCKGDLLGTSNTTETVDLDHVNDTRPTWCNLIDHERVYKQFDTYDTYSNGVALSCGSWTFQNCISDWNPQHSLPPCGTGSCIEK
jgi:hypothetical protein